MAPKKSPPLLSLALIILRAKYGWTQKDLADAYGVSHKTLSGWENGDPAFTRQRLDELAAVMGLGPLRVEMVILAARVLDVELPPPVSVVDPTDEQRLIVEQGVAMAIRDLIDLFGLFGEPLVMEVRAENTRHELRIAEGLWRSLEPESGEKRRTRISKDSTYHHWSVCLFLCDESERKAAHDAGEARELAELAGIVAQQLREREPGDRFFTRLEGQVEAFLANALRVAGDHDLSEAGFARTWTLWKEGSDEAGLLSEARILDLEASLRKDQGRYEEALCLHAKALERARPDEEGAFLLKKASTLDLMGNHVGALAAFERAAPLIDGKRHPRLRWVLRQNQTLSLIRLGRVEEARSVVTEAQQLAEELRNGLDLLRTRVVTALVDAGLGKTDEAIESLEQVCGKFRDRGHAFDYALIGLDLALLYREEGRWAEIRELAVRMVEIFRERKIHRETIAAIVLFKEAAAKEAVSVELVRRLQVYLKQAQARPGLRFEA